MSTGLCIYLEYKLKYISVAWYDGQVVRYHNELFVYIKAEVKFVAVGLRICYRS